MKFMKLGSRPDTFQTEGDNVRYVATDLASDVIITVGDVKFYLHKFPLLSKSAKLQKLVTSATEANLDEVHVPDIPGGPPAFEICVKFCYGMAVTLNAYNVVMARCAAEYLEMYETVEKGNLIYKIEVFLSSSVFRSWKDSIIVLKTSKALFPMPDDLKLVTHCVESIASKVSVDTSKVDWSYTYNRKKLAEENGIESDYNCARSRTVPQDWWVEDLCDLDIALYKRVISSVKSKAAAQPEVIGEALKAYVYRWLPSFGKGLIQSSDTGRSQSIIEEIVWLLPAEKGSVSCSFLLKLLKAASVLELGEKVKGELVTRIGQQLEEATVNDLLIRAPAGQGTTYDVDTVRKMLLEFVLLDKKAAEAGEVDGYEIQDIRKAGGILSEASKLMVAKLVDGYLTEISKDPNLPLAKFLVLAEMVSGFNRPGHDGLYRAIDTYLKEHPGITKSERKKICKLMDCRKLSVDACMHAVQNERLPLRVVVQVLFFEQVRAAASSGCSTPDLPKGIKDLANCSHRSSRSATTNTEEDWDAVATVEELKALKGELAALRLANGGHRLNVGDLRNPDKAAISKMKGLLMSKKVFARLWSSKGASGGSVAETSGSDSSESPNPDEGKSTPSRNRRYSVS
uniref:Uncharacterized protein n=1 Tax=Kalanchoe fedtschenkoi TaxID=63787 RepID=A0A7N0TMX1_KALFE